jgi:hypothetical protein
MKIKRKYSIPDEDVFIEKVRAYFGDLTEKYGYTEANVINEKLYAEITYLNTKIKRRIEIKNETHGVDYGFSIFIYNTADEEYNIPVNIPWDKEDDKCRFVERSSKFFFENLRNIIDGSEWKTFGKILLKE